jgi:hypothetical protein
MFTNKRVIGAAVVCTGVLAAFTFAASRASADDAALTVKPAVLQSAEGDSQGATIQLARYGHGGGWGGGYRGGWGGGYRGYGYRGFGGYGYRPYYGGFGYGLGYGLGAGLGYGAYGYGYPGYGYGYPAYGYGYPAYGGVGVGIW